MRSNVSPTDRLVGENIRRIRLGAGFTQVQLANLAGVTSQQIQNYESGADSVCASKLADISAALEVDVRSLSASLSELPAASSAPEDQEALRRIRRDELRRTVVILVHSLAANDDPS